MSVQKTQFAWLCDPCHPVAPSQMVKKLVKWHVKPGFLDTESHNVCDTIIILDVSTDWISSSNKNYLSVWSWLAFVWLHEQDLLHVPLQDVEILYIEIMTNNG